jgi:hypothetical protein
MDPKSIILTICGAIVFFVGFYVLGPYTVEKNRPDDNPVTSTTVSQPPEQDGFMTPEQSIDWLEAQGYKIERNNNGYTLKREVVRQGITIREAPQIGWRSTTVLDKGVTITTIGGAIRVKVSNTQQ